MSDWTNLGLPLPQKAGYGYTLDPGFIASPFETSHARIKASWKEARRTFSVSFLVTQSELSTAITFLRTYGYSWFTIPLYSGLGTDLQDHTVRVVDDFKVDIVGKDYLRITVPLETQLIIEAPSFETDVPYLPDIHCPIDVDDVCNPVVLCASVHWYRNTNEGWIDLGANPIISGWTQTAGTSASDVEFAVAVKFSDGLWGMWNDSLMEQNDYGSSPHGYWETYVPTPTPHYEFEANPQGLLYHGVWTVRHKATHYNENITVWNNNPGGWMRSYFDNWNETIIVDGETVRPLYQFWARKVNVNLPATFYFEPMMLGCTCAGPVHGTLTLA